MSEEERKQKRRQAREEEKARLLGQIDRGLTEASSQMNIFISNYKRLIEEGGELDERINSWQRFFNDVSLVSEDRTTGEASSASVSGKSGEVDK